MGRKKKQKDIEEAITDDKTAERRKNSELTEDEKRALHSQHRKEYETALADKKAADAHLKNVCKTAKAELGKDAVADIKSAIALDEPGGEAAHRAEIDRMLKIARWMGAPVGTQFTFTEDMTPAVDKAREAGKRAGLAGEPRHPPHDATVPQHGAWCEGWQEGQAVLASDFRKKVNSPPIESELEHVDTSDRPFATAEHASA